MTRPADLRGRYGPWAVIVGASEGVGAELALELAGRGFSLVLLARRQGRLDEVAVRARAAGAAEVRSVAVDLTEDDAVARVVAATTGLEVGLLFYCAGADPDYLPFLDNSTAAAEAMLRRNCAVPMRLAHHFAPAMVERGRGGIVLVSSGAGFFGGPNMVTYAATKAFDMIFAEGLWAELKPHGVDVVGLVLGETDTPAFRRLRHERRLASSPDEPVPGAATPAEVVSAALAGLPKGPTVYAGRQIRRAARMVYPVPRGLMVRIAARAAARAMGSGTG